MHAYIAITGSVEKHMQSAPKMCFCRFLNTELCFCPVPTALIMNVSIAEHITLIARDYVYCFWSKHGGNNNWF